MASASKNKKKLALSNDELGKPDSLRHNVLNWVSGEQYPKAVEALKAYVDSQPQFPAFKERAIRYLEYAVDLVNGIRAKKSFPGLSQLPMNKQEELFTRAYEHFEDLKMTIRKVEKIEREVRLEDKRSTVWVIRAIIHSAMAIVALGIMIEISKGVLDTAGNVVDDSLSRFTETISKMVGL